MKDFEIDENNWFLGIVKGWLQNKEDRSRVWAKDAPKADSIPNFTQGTELATIEAINDYIKSNFVYVSDPLGGAIDYYTHPLTVQHEVNEGTMSFGKDCDDFSSYAYYALIHSGLNPEFVTVATIVPDLTKDITQIKWCHVICVFDYKNTEPDNNGFSWKGTIDTNGLHWFKYKKTDNPELDNEIVIEDILKLFSKLYRTEYKYLIDHGYAFDD